MRLIFGEYYGDPKSIYADDSWQQQARYKPNSALGIQAFRWAKTVDDVHAVLGNPRADELGTVPLLNSWARSTRAASTFRTLCFRS
ncbi:hypothetical protein AB0F91_43780 [Amycolatopsis sp. NPDC023774]|uniref:hypothetical protein n=1 Tax=Amycolatopsis sp. NPDC023774 TaxID=3155015 RepID=UPI0033EE21C3